MHPSRLGRIAALLRSIASDLTDSNSNSWPRQVVVNTHSPKFMAEVVKANLALVRSVRFVARGQKRGGRRSFPSAHRLLWKSPTD